MAYNGQSMFAYLKIIENISNISVIKSIFFLGIRIWASILVYQYQNPTGYVNDIWKSKNFNSYEKFYGF